MKILVVGDPHGKLGKIKNLNLRKFDLILITGDLGKADLTRKRAFENIERKQEGLSEIKDDKEFIKKSTKEIYDSSMKILRYLSKYAPVYTLSGNTWMSDDESKRDEKRFGIRLPYLHKDMKKLKNVHLIGNSFRNIKGLKIGFLEFFIDVSWIREFKPDMYSKRLKSAKKETEKVKKILKRFSGNKIDILVCHQPPYGILDKVTWKKAPKKFKGRRAGSKTILEFIKKNKTLKYVFCGHIHEAKGKKRLGKTLVVNAGCCGDYYVVDID